MSFARPEYLWLLLAAAPLVAILRRSGVQRSNAWRVLEQRGLSPGLRSVSLLIGLALLALSLSRPRFGPAIGPPLPPGHDVVLQIDVSRSMAVEDAVPNRLAVAVEAAGSLLYALAPESANRVGVVAFAGRGVLRCPLTENLGAVADVLQRLRPGSVQPGGTDLAAGLDAALDVFGQEEHAQGRSIIILSDGEDHGGRWRNQLERLGRSGVVVHVVAIGDADRGHPIPMAENGPPMIYQGGPVQSRRDDGALEAIAQQTGGAIVRLGLAATDLGELYRSRIAPAARRQREASRVPDRPEQFPLFLAAALGFVLSSSWPPGLSGPLRWAWARIAGGLLLTSLVVTGLGAGDNSAAAPAAERVRHGEQAYRAGRFDLALVEFEAATQAAPSRAIPRYNAAATLFQLGRYPEALDAYLGAHEQAGPALRVKIDYALGNTALALGDIPAAVSYYDRCLASTIGGDGLQDVRRDAEVNRRFAIEQAPPSVAPEGDDDQPADRPRPRNQGPSGGQPPDSGDQPGSKDPQTAESSPDGSSPPRQGKSGDQPPGRRHRVGGGGGASREAEGSPGITPDGRLDQAVEQIRDARNRRLPDEDSEPSPDDGRKDW